MTTKLSEATCCRCKGPFSPAPWQIKSHEMICKPCRRLRDADYRKRRKAEGRPVVSGKPTPKARRVRVDPQLALWTRLWSYVEKGSGCWNWTGYTDKQGYGRLQIGRRPGPKGAHRLVYELIYGKTDLCILHHCDNPACVRPDHLHAGTRGDNAREAVERGRHKSQLKTHCCNGHLFAPPNLAFTRKGKKRVCITCRRNYCRQQRIRAKQSAEGTSLCL